MASEPPKIDFCIRCGEYTRPGASFCPKCGASLGDGISTNAEVSPVAATKRPVWAGALLLLTGLVAFALSSYFLLDSSSIAKQMEEAYGDVPGIEGVLIVMAGYIALAGALSVIGGICAVRRRHYAMALVGAFFGATTIGFFIEATVMAVIALFLLVTSKQEFRR